MWTGMTEDAADDEVSPSDAVEWFVANGADEEPGAWHLRRWEVWFARAGNRADYVGVCEIGQELRMFPPPRGAGREVLVQDLVSEAPRRCDR
jgi:hypothetical protein